MMTVTQAAVRGEGGSWYAGICTDLRLPQTISWGPGAALTFQVLVSWCCVLLTAFTCETCCLHTARVSQGSQCHVSHRSNQSSCHQPKSSEPWSRAA